MSVAEKFPIPVPPVAEPEEFDPVDLLWLVRQHFHWNTSDFSTVFGWEVNTIQKWCYGIQRPSRQARIHAAILKRIWGV